MKLAYIGIGNMGAPIARNLLRAGHQLTVYNRNRSKAESLVSDGVVVAESPASAVQDCKAVFTMLSDDPALEEVTWGPGGFGPVLPSDVPHISQSTITIACAQRFAMTHQAKGQNFVSAPVFGRPEAAANKRLVVVTAGDPKLTERVQPLFDAIGRRTFHVGAEPWQANAVKLCGNLMVLSLVETFGEAFAGVRKSDIDPHLFFDIITELFGSPVYQSYGSTIVNERFDPPGFALRNGLKDIRYILELAQDRGAPMPLASLIRDNFLSAIAHGDSEIDAAALARVAARSANLP